MRSEVRVFRELADFQAYRQSLGARASLGFVPTMGALHAGHAALIRRSARENGRTLVSIFVNPTQFNDPTDLEKYPRTLEADLELIRDSGGTLALVPEYRALYPDEYRYRVAETGLSSQLCGAHRPGHFDGMLTVVLKLLQLVSADHAYFGEKDYQQLKLVEGMARAFFVPTRIVPCATVREPDGLAMSSRNRRLTAEERVRAAHFPHLLRTEPSLARALEKLEELGFEVDYLEECLGRRLGAVRLGGVRLIDNFAPEELGEPGAPRP